MASNYTEVLVNPCHSKSNSRAILRPTTILLAKLKNHALERKESKINVSVDF